MSDLNEQITCERHGESHATFVCGHLPGSLGAGFFVAEESADPRPDAWCQRCDEVVASRGDWDDVSEAFADVTVVCAGCYDEIRKDNTRREKGTAEPFMEADSPSLMEDALAGATRTEETLVADGDHFVRVCLELPVTDGSGPLVYGVWVTLSEENFAEFTSRLKAPDRFQDGPYFGWFSNSLPGWPETLELKTRVHLRPPPLRPVIELEPTDHPLAVAQREGLSPERWRVLLGRQ